MPGVSEGPGRRGRWWNPRGRSVKEASVITPRMKPLYRAQEGRVCRAEGCGTILSVYNTRLDCALHE